MNSLEQINDFVQKGRARQITAAVQEALDAGCSADEVLQALMDGMSVIGEKFKKEEVYVPEVLIAARAMNTGMAVVKPVLRNEGIAPKGRVVIGTVQGDLHDIGKNLVRLLLESKGIEVIDLGVDVPAEKFVQTAVDENCQIICCSALLTSTMGAMREVVDTAIAKGVREKVKIFIGGAPINEAFRERIGADVYTSDAASAADKALDCIREMTA